MRTEIQSALDIEPRADIKKRLSDVLAGANALNA